MKNPTVQIPVNHICITADRFEELIRDSAELPALIRKLQRELDDALSQLKSVRSDLEDAMQKNDELVKQLDEAKDSSGYWYTKYDELRQEKINAVPEKKG